MSPGYTKVILALGSNLGSATTLFPRPLPTSLIRRRSASWGFSGGADQGRRGPEGQPDFLNMVMAVETTLTPLELLKHCHEIEQKHHRTREVRWGPRTLDVDIIVFGDLASDDPVLTIPHPRAAERAFVLYPWSLLEPHARLNGHSVAELAAVAADMQDIRRFDGFGDVAGVPATGAVEPQ